MMKTPVVVVGIGEMGSVFARGFLRIGHPVFPVTRDTSQEKLAAELPAPRFVLVATAESDLHPTLERLPDVWRDRIVLLQNELLPADWQGIADPTVISVWFEKKKGMDSKVIIPSPVYGPQAALLVQALAALDIPARELGSPTDLLFELVLKNLYILTSNLSGLRTGGTVGDLWSRHQDFARQVAGEVIDLQEALTGERFDRARLIAAMADTFAADPRHQCMGRSAPARLARALEHGDRLRLSLPTLRALHREPTGH